MNSILQSSYSRILESQKEQMPSMGQFNVGGSGFFQNMGELEKASTRLADRAAGREMLLQRQKTLEEMELEKKRAEQEARRLRIEAMMKQQR
jgi:hypothetical protein